MRISKRDVVEKICSYEKPILGGAHVRFGRRGLASARSAIGLLFKGSGIPPQELHNFINKTTKEQFKNQLDVTYIKQSREVKALSQVYSANEQWLLMLDLFLESLYGDDGISCQETIRTELVNLVEGLFPEEFHIDLYSGKVSGVVWQR